MNEKIEDVIVDSVVKNQKKYNGKPVVRNTKNEK